MGNHIKPWLLAGPLSVNSNKQSHYLSGINVVRNVYKHAYAVSSPGYLWRSNRSGSSEKYHCVLYT